MKKILSILVIIAISFYGVMAQELPNRDFSTNVSAMGQSNYMRKAMASRSMTSPFINSFATPYNLKTDDNLYPLYMLSKNMEVPTTAEVITPGSDNPVEVEDDGILYIIQNGYDFENDANSIFASEKYGAVSDVAIKQYITQVALWLYIYQNKNHFKNSYCANGNCDFLDSNNNVVEASDVYSLIEQAASFSGYNYLNYILELVNKAKTYKKDSSQLSSIAGESFTFTVDKEKKLLTTEVIQPKAKGNVENFLRFAVTLEDPNQYGAYFINENNEKIEDLNSISGAFRLVVPLLEEIEKMDLSTIRVTITGYFQNDSVFEYHITDSRQVRASDQFAGYSNLLLTGVQPQEIANSYALQNFVSISALGPTNTGLVGATMVLTKKGDKDFKETWISNGEAHYIQLRNGDYTLCEEEAPAGYAASTECFDFSVDGANVTVLNVQNREEDIVIPNTSLFQSKYARLIGMILLLIGTFIITKVMKKENKD